MRFGGIVALDGISFDVQSGHICGIIGPNGAGKTTLFNCLSRLYTPDSGEIIFDDKNLLRRPQHTIASAGIGRTFQNVALFSAMTVIENVMVGRHCRTHTGYIANALRLRSVQREESNVRERSHALLNLLALAEVADRPVKELPFATRKRVEFARALASEPKLLLLDEPAAGLNHEEVEALRQLILEIRDRLRVHDPVGRTPPQSRHAGIESGGGDELRSKDRRRPAVRGAGRSGSHTRLSRSGGRQVSALLEVRRLEAFYGGSRVLKEIDFDVVDGGITTILGANGAGKTTTLRAVSALVKTAGEIRFEGRRIDGLSTEKIAGLGVAHVPDGRGTLFNLTVEENLRVGAYLRRDRRQAAADFDRVYDYFPRLRERSAQQAGTLSGGEQQMLAIGRALMLRPKLLLLDEPSFGLAPLIISEIFEIMRIINTQERVSILLVEQNVSLALALADHAYLLETGRTVKSGTSAAFLNDEQIRRSYLGF